MAIRPLLDKTVGYLKKYRYAVLIFLIGLLLMFLPTEKKVAESNISRQETKTEESFEQRLEHILSNMEGAGEVEVILTLSAGEKTLYQTDDDDIHSADDISTRSKTIITTDSNRNETGLIKQVLPAVYQGAIVVCQGADDPNVCYNIVNAISRLTGIGANCISVLKMK